MIVGFIGAGKVGCTLGKYFSSCGIEVAGFYSRSYEHAKQASEFTQSHAFLTLAELVAKCDCLLVTVSDSQIAEVWYDLCQLPIGNKWLGHCSGLLTSHIFSQNKIVHPFAFSLHPLYAIYDRFDCFSDMVNVSFTLEANADIIPTLTEFFAKLPNPIAILPAIKKPLYHAACVMLSNQVLALVQIGVDLLNEQCGLDQEFSEQAWHPLFLGNANNACRAGIIDALTGPVERGDVETIKQHIMAMPDELKPIYQQLSTILLNISRKKHPNRDYKQLELEL
ncbi:MULTISPECIES: Rossmann-like and DUF2520 domain-containing protein [unclassified Gilliamella]|uniref:Rossmann-like and DUF2520 domain-containing protein n=1 Tax=unclassified Gilliamella TaxID=2685620 RepID=UPI00226A4A60|nr:MULTISPECIES: Rossmann-like and DUF2520 domain-containing protein [unclassified Gilliamella]MCX8602197.1 DUF2520 domain-containing protein [Gilliamella sp. B3722]MCX8607181.1 DUF2520 domain-containing protein [Gilliamella sp. B3771]MCX8611467.1 DUF2520 domain-containing protein [Gilliamella sp. B3891]MCX8613937.1 DUF2520 domain-containing protein [Gilliamella sp. B3773]MCX8614913.1 DUF2520 domain-containing protein [Gilliamella sp. B3770]